MLKSSSRVDDYFRMPTASTLSQAPRILLVEDDKSIFNACAILFRHYEFNVTIATTLAEAKPILATGFDLVILDLLLPDGEGTDLLQQVRTFGIRSKVFILTGSNDKTSMLKIRRWMPDKFFRKPLNFLEILQATREALTPAAAAESQTPSFQDAKRPAA